MGYVGTLSALSLETMKKLYSPIHSSRYLGDYLVGVKWNCQIGLSTQ